MAKGKIESVLLRATREAIRPFVRRILKAGITYGQVEHHIRELFVEVAENDFALPKPRQSDSRISVLTGINRKEVRRIRDKKPGTHEPKSFTRNYAADLVSLWIADPRATNAAGRPIPIPYDTARGPSFVKLAEQTTTDIQPRALLDVLVSAGAAEIRKGKVVALTRSAYVPKRGHPEALAMLADDPAELIETMLHNVLGEDAPPLLQQKLAYDNLGSEGLERLREALRKEALRFLKKSDSVLQRHDRDRNPKAPDGTRTYAGIGVYYFESPREASPEPPETKKRPRKKRTGEES